MDEQQEQKPAVVSGVERTAAAATKNRLIRLRRMAKELRDHGWSVEEPTDAPPVRPDVPRGGL